MILQAPLCILESNPTVKSMGTKKFRVTKREVGQNSLVYIMNLSRPDHELE